MRDLTGTHAPILEIVNDEPITELSTKADIAHLQYEARKKDKMLFTDLDALNRTKKEMAAIITALHPVD